MKRRIITFIISILMLLSIFTVPAATAQAADKNTDDIIILYENDVHCAVEGYSKLAAMKKELLETHAHVGVVSSGDYIQGSSLGVFSQGEYIVNLMNLVGYDALALGNHEFDYTITRLEELIDKMNTKPVCCNFQIIGENDSYFEPYTIVSYADVDIAYIGITTPSTLTKSSPSQFKDENGEFLYTFNPSKMFEIVQASIDAAKADGADYVIALSHIGYKEDETFGDVVDIETLIENTSGFDVVLDAHSHSVIEGMTVTDKSGNDVLLTSTGTKFEYIGKLTISQGEFRSELIRTEDYQKTDAAVDAYINIIEEEYAELGNRKVGTSKVDLITHDKDGNRLVRIMETNIGDFCSDAFRTILNADIGYINGGSLRAEIHTGDITFNDLLSVIPYNNMLVLAELDGQTIKDMLEMAVRSWPAEGSFPHPSGITFSVNTQIPSSVVLDDAGEFVCVDGQYRVYDLKVFNKDTGKYEPLELDKMYTMAAFDYLLIEHGSGMKMLENAKILQDDGLLDIEALEMYITDHLGGVIGEEYRETSYNITFTDGEITSPDTGDNQITIITTTALFTTITLFGIIIIKKKQFTIY